MKIIKKKIQITFCGVLVDLLNIRTKSKNITKRLGETFYSIQYEFVDRRSVKDLIESFGIPHTEVDVIIVNNKSVKFSYLIADNDRIEVYPHLSNLFWQNYNYLVNPDIDLVHLKPKMPKHKKFICDVHLGSLVKKLRMLGFDVYYKNDLLDEEIVKISNSKCRIILTRDLGLLKRSDVKWGYYVRNNNVEDQVKEILSKFELNSLINFLTRCLKCGEKIKKVGKDKIKDRVGKSTLKFYDEFYMCTKCNKVYWPGSHYKAMTKFIDKTIKYLVK